MVERGGSFLLLRFQKKMDDEAHPARRLTPEERAALSADATLRRMESDATFRVRGPTTGAADLARLTHELLHSPCYHGKRCYHERRAEAETGLANRFALDPAAYKGAPDPHNVPGNLKKW